MTVHKRLRRENKIQFFFTLTNSIYALTKLELQEIQRRIDDEPHIHVPNDSKSEDEQWLLDFDEKGGDVFLKYVRVVVEDIGNRHENAEFGFRIKEELIED